MSATKKLAEKFLSLLLAFSLLSPTLAQAAGASEGGTELSGRSGGESLNLGASAAEQGLDLSGPEAAGARIDETVAPIGANLSGLEFPLPSVEASDGADSNGEKRDDIKPQAAQGGGSDAADSGSAADAREGLKASAAGNGAASPKDSALGELQDMAGAMRDIAARQELLKNAQARVEARKNVERIGPRQSVVLSTKRLSYRAKTNGSSNQSGGTTPFFTVENWENLVKQNQAVSAEVRQEREKADKIGVQEASLETKLIREFNFNDYPKETSLNQHGILDQKKTGKCWLISEKGRIFAETGVMISSAWLYALSVVEKTNHVYQDMITQIFSILKKQKKHKNKEKLAAALGDVAAVDSSFIEDGGNYQWIQYLIYKFGVVPEEVMPETFDSQNTDGMIANLKNNLAVFTNALVGAAQMGKLTPEVAAQIKDLAMEDAASIMFGSMTTPKLLYKNRGKFKYKDAWYTPQEFASQVVKFDPQRDVVVTNYPGMPKGHLEFAGSAIEVPAPKEEAFPVSFLNQGGERLLELIALSVLAKHETWVGIDVVHDVHVPSGLGALNIYGKKAKILNIPKERLEPSREQAFATGQRGANHAVRVVAAKIAAVVGGKFIPLTFVDGKPGAVIKGKFVPVFSPDGKQNYKLTILQLKIANSWGKEDVGRNTGDLDFTREWLLENLYEGVIPKSNLTASEQKQVKTPAKVLGDDNQ